MKHLQMWAMPRAAWLQYIEKKMTDGSFIVGRKKREENKSKQKTGIIIITL